MAAGKITLQANDGKILGLVAPEGMSADVIQTVATLESPSFTGTPTAPTAAAGTNTTQIATTAFVQTANGGAWVANDSRAKTALNASGTAPIYACRAWVNFNGTGTVAIRASGNISSIADIGAGRYNINMIIPMQDSNYAVVASSGNSNASNRWVTVDADIRTSSMIPIVIANESGGASDVSYVNVAILR